MGISQYRLAKDISVPARRINEIVHAARAISPDTALRLSRSLIGDILDESAVQVQPGSGEGSPEGPIGEGSTWACDAIALYSQGLSQHTLPNKLFQRGLAAPSSLISNVDDLGYTYHEFKKRQRLTSRLPIADVCLKTHWW